jgi:hypothetical protein
MTVPPCKLAAAPVNTGGPEYPVFVGIALLTVPTLILIVPLPLPGVGTGTTGLLTTGVPLAGTLGLLNAGVLFEASTGLDEDLLSPPYGIDLGVPGTGLLVRVMIFVE